MAGSRKGIPNKIGAAVKSNVIAVFDRIGGRDRMAQWAEENLTEFYRLYAKLIPTEASLTIDIRDASDYSDGELISIATGGSAGAVGETSGDALAGQVH